MSRRKWISYGCVLFILLMLGGCGNTTAQSGEDNISGEEKVKLFDTITDIEDFQGVPVMTVTNGKVEVQGDIGAGNQVAVVNGSEADEYVSNNIEGAETTLHMMELNAAGNCFIIQLKNGHFIVDDGGREADLPYLLEYLEG